MIKECISYLNISSNQLLYSHGLFSRLALLKLANPDFQASFTKTMECKETGFGYSTENPNQQISVLPIIDVIGHELSNLSKEYLALVKFYSSSEIYDLILHSEDIDIKPSNIPQFSNENHGIYKIVDDLYNSGNFGPDFCKVGYYLLGDGRNEMAYKKYGENHSKLAESLDLVCITKESPRKVYLTELGIIFRKTNDELKNKILRCQILKIPIIKKIIKDGIPSSNYLELLNHYLSLKTASRRLPNLKALLSIIQNLLATDREQ